MSHSPRGCCHRRDRDRTDNPRSLMVPERRWSVLGGESREGLWGNDWKSDGNEPNTGRGGAGIIRVPQAEGRQEKQGGLGSERGEGWR